MKNPTLHDETNLNQFNSTGKPAVGQLFKLGLDVDLRNVVVAIPCERGAIAPAHKWTRGQLIGWVKEKVAAGHAVHTVYECCGFGYTLHEQLTQAGAPSIITTPMRLNLERCRKPDSFSRRTEGASHFG